MTRSLSSHKANDLSNELVITVRDAPGCGGACHDYLIASLDVLCPIKFQDGPVQEAGVNGVSNESLLAVVEDRLIGFQSGGYACRENAIALTKLQEAMMWLHKRTRDRMARGVEGTMEK